ncbi:hypothetical protein BGZ68_007140 [Mortierella alpina]|nr:hypothetical protein BGZ68_007140 [Mortierella alpina]
MESWSPDSGSSSASDSYMTDAATVVRRLFNNPLYSDLALSVEGTTFHVHRGILAEHCAYFRTLFDNARSRNPTSEIKTVDCTFKPVTVERARRVMIARAKKGDHEKKVDDASKSQIRENSGGSGSTGGMSGQEDRRDMAANSNEFGTEDTISENPLLERGSANLDPNSCLGKAKASGSTVLDGSNAQSTKESPLIVPSSGSSKSSSENLTNESIPSETVSATKTFSAMFVSDERSMGYTSHHFALFLQQLYGILGPTELDLVDLLPVLRVAYIHGVPGLIAVLADQIFDSLALSVETWPAAIRFAERYQLQDIRRRALEHASADKSLWKLAVEMLSLDDFKVFLRGIGQTRVGRDHKAEDLRGMRDELLTIDDPSLARRDSGGSEGFQPEVRKCSRDGQKRNASSIRQQLQTPSLWTRYSSKSLRLSDQVESRTLKLNVAAVGQSEQSLQASEVDFAPTDRADNAKSWMIGFKRECGWDGRLSYLD